MAGSQEMDVQLINAAKQDLQVENLTATIGVGVRWSGLPSILKASTTQALLTVMATNPPVWVARKNRTDFVKNFVHSKADQAVKK